MSIATANHRHDDDDDTSPKFDHQVDHEGDFIRLDVITPFTLYSVNLTADEAFELLEEVHSALAELASGEPTADLPAEWTPEQPF